MKINWTMKTNLKNINIYQSRQYEHFLELFRFTIGYIQQILYLNKVQALKHKYELNNTG